LGSRAGFSGVLLELLAGVGLESERNKVIVLLDLILSKYAVEKYLSLPTQRVIGPRWKRGSDVLRVCCFAFADQELGFCEDDVAGRVGKAFSAQGINVPGMLSRIHLDLGSSEEYGGGGSSPWSDHVAHLLRSGEDKRDIGADHPVVLRRANHSRRETIYLHLPSDVGLSTHCIIASGIATRVNKPCRFPCSICRHDRRILLLMPESGTATVLLEQRCVTPQPDGPSTPNRLDA